MDFDLWWSISATAIPLRTEVSVVGIQSPAKRLTCRRAVLFSTQL